MNVLDILMRYLHVISAVLAVGGAFFVAFLLPSGLKLIEEPLREQVLLKVRRAYKMTVHPAILLLIVSGVYNSRLNWPAYKLNMAFNHAFWGPHVILGAIAMGLSLWLLAGKSLRTNHRRWMRINVVLLLVVIALASILRAARRWTVATHAAGPPVQQVERTPATQPSD